MGESRCARHATLTSRGGRSATCLPIPSRFTCPCRARAQAGAVSRATPEVPMARCDVCGNDYEHSFTVQTTRGDGVFDSFECAIHALAPRCAHCSCAVIGHGVG